MSFDMLTWSLAVESNVEECRGKGWNLAQLHHYGFTIPNGGVITAGLYRDVMGTEKARVLIERIETLQADDLSVADHPPLLQIQMSILATPLPHAFKQALVEFIAQQKLTAVAVRSSSATEDRNLASFAGIHGTWLNVQGSAASSECSRIVQHRQIWRSPESEQRCGIG